MAEFNITMKEVNNVAEAMSFLGRDTRKIYLDQLRYEERVRSIISRVVKDQDKALRDITSELDGCLVETPKVNEKELEDSWNSVPAWFKEDVEKIDSGIQEYHDRHTRDSWWYRRGPHLLAEINRAIDTVAIYVPGGRAAYPSSLLMAAIPARIAGVRRMVVLTPPRSDGTVHPFTLATAHFLGIREVFRVGGAQAIAAAAFGTETVPRVDKVVGPGNLYVTLAKKLLSDVVGIDILAGPSEVVIMAEPPAHLPWLALDLLAQAEHDPFAQAILISTSRDVLTGTYNIIEQKVAHQPLTFERSVPVWLFRVPDRFTAWHISDQLAPEHLEIVYPEGEDAFMSIPRAGAVLMGPTAPVALGDYGFGPNHVIPTRGGCRFSSPLGTDDFYTRSSLIAPGKKDKTPHMELYARLAEAEGFTYHQLSLLARLEIPEGMDT